MLGSMIADYLSRHTSLGVTATARTPSFIEVVRERIPGVVWELFDADTPESGGDLFLRGRFAWVINAIGVIKPYIDDTDPVSVERAIRVNALFPHSLAHIAAEVGFRVLQIATDCVYSGREGSYAENAPHDPLDVYGKTKSLGETTSRSMYHMRCSIIGPEPKGNLSLLEWFLGQPVGAEVTGFKNHRWNGISTLQFARACAGIIQHELEIPNTVHLIPEGHITKAELLDEFATFFLRNDIKVTHGDAPTVIDRTLKTVYPEVSEQLWRAAGYTRPPSIREMIEELGEYPYPLKGIVE